MLHPAIDLRIAYQFLPASSHQDFWRAYGVVDEITQVLAKLSTISHSVTIAWYAHQVVDEDLLEEALQALHFIKGFI